MGDHETRTGKKLTESDLDRMAALFVQNRNKMTSKERTAFLMNLSPADTAAFALRVKSLTQSGGGPKDKVVLARHPAPDTLPELDSDIQADQDVLDQTQDNEAVEADEEPDAQALDTDQADDAVEILAEPEVELEEVTARVGTKPERKRGLFSFFRGERTKEVDQVAAADDVIGQIQSEYHKKAFKKKGEDVVDRNGNVVTQLDKDVEGLLNASSRNKTAGKLGREFVTAYLDKRAPALSEEGVLTSGVLHAFDEFNQRLEDNFNLPDLEPVELFGLSQDDFAHLPIGERNKILHVLSVGTQRALKAVTVERAQAEVNSWARDYEKSQLTEVATADFREYLRNNPLNSLLLKAGSRLREIVPFAKPIEVSPDHLSEAFVAFIGEPDADINDEIARLTEVQSLIGSELVGYAENQKKIKEIQEQIEAVKNALIKYAKEKNLEGFHRGTNASDLDSIQQTTISDETTNEKFEVWINSPNNLVDELRSHDAFIPPRIKDLLAKLDTLEESLLPNGEVAVQEADVSLALSLMGTTIDSLDNESRPILAAVAKQVALARAEKRLSTFEKDLEPLIEAARTDRQVHRRDKGEFDRAAFYDSIAKLLEKVIDEDVDQIVGRIKKVNGEVTQSLKDRGLIGGAKEENDEESAESTSEEIANFIKETDFGVIKVKRDNVITQEMVDSLGSNLSLGSQESGEASLTPEQIDEIAANLSKESEDVVLDALISAKSELSEDQFNDLTVELRNHMDKSKLARILAKIESK